MKERPIIFSVPMIQAIRAGRKSQTRRPIDPKKFGANETHDSIGAFRLEAEGWRARADNWNVWSSPRPCPLGVPDDRLWVRETSAQWPPASGINRYRADGEFTDEERAAGARWTGGFLMPRTASRITLEITDVRAERLWGISEKDAISEGIDGLEESPRAAFQRLWESIYETGPTWDRNPWVWVIGFRLQARTFFLNEAHETWGKP